MKYGTCYYFVHTKEHDYFNEKNKQINSVIDSMIEKLDEIGVNEKYDHKFYAEELRNFALLNYSVETFCILEENYKPYYFSQFPFDCSSLDELEQWFQNNNSDWAIVEDDIESTIYLTWHDLMEKINYNEKFELESPYYSI
ncbi:hypothetical protein MKX73_19335 [Solibacillus sp. FSL W7-1436]|uniref:hypothetical protein n=1 Tax=Solibacillus sp. FSL W7-1436 TaxID=2921705 RepID=UPI0030FB0EE9